MPKYFSIGQLPFGDVFQLPVQKLLDKSECTISPFSLLSPQSRKFMPTTRSTASLCILMQYFIALLGKTAKTEVHSHQPHAGDNQLPLFSERDTGLQELVLAVNPSLELEASDMDTLAALPHLQRLDLRKRPDEGGVDAHYSEASLAVLNTIRASYNGILVE